MATVKPFKGIRPPRELVEKVESRPYDVLDSEEARQEAGDNEMSLYHIIKPEIDFPVGTSEYDPILDLHSHEGNRPISRANIQAGATTSVVHLQSLPIGI